MSDVSTTPANSGTHRVGPAGATAAVVFTVAGVAGYLVETTARTPGFDDGDNPAQSVALFAVNPTPYSLSGLALAVAALALLVLVLAVREAVLRRVRPLYATFVTALGLISAAFLFLAGVIRLQAPGTVTHITSLDREWGLAAYLAVQMSGTQGALSAAIFACALWVVGLCLLAGRALPVTVRVLGALPALALLLPLMALLGRLARLPALDALYPAYLVAIFVGLPMFMLALGVTLLRMRNQPVG